MRKKISESYAYMIRDIYAAIAFFAYEIENTVLHIYGFLLKDMGSEMFLRNRVSLSCLSCGVRSFQRCCTKKV